MINNNEEERSNRPVSVCLVARITLAWLISVIQAKFGQAEDIHMHLFRFQHKMSQAMDIHMHLFGCIEGIRCARFCSVGCMDFECGYLFIW